MRRAFTVLGARGAAALGLAVLVLAVLGIAKLASGSNRPSGLHPGGDQTETYVDPTAGDDGVAGTAPTTRDDPAVRAVAEDFVTAWLRSNLSGEAWRAGLASNATPSLMESLAGVDPSTVPATRVTGRITITLNASAYAEVAVPVDAGTVLLSLVRRDGRWLVDGVDWDRP